VRVRSVAIAIGLTVAFFLWHSALLSPEGRVRGFSSDAAVIGLMGKRMLEGRGFDLFFWGQNYVGPLTSIFIAGAGAVIGTVDPLALRIGTFAETLLGILLAGWAVSRIDRRAGVITAIALAITPPTVLRMMITPLGAEMAFVLSAALLCVLLQQLTAPANEGWLSRAGGQCAFGMLTGFSWWMNQQVIFTLMAAAVVFGWQSHLFGAVRRQLHLRDRLLLRWDAIGWRRMPGVIEAFVWVIVGSGYLLLLAFLVRDLLRLHTLPFVIGPVADPLVLILVPQLLLPLLLGEWRRWRLPQGEEWNEVRTVLRFAAGFVIGYTPVWLGRILGWYEPSYVFSIAISRPSFAVRQFRFFVEQMAAHWAGLAPGILGGAFALILCITIGYAVLRIWRGEPQSRARALLAWIPLLNFVFFLFSNVTKPHYLIASVAMLFGLAALGATDLWDRLHGWSRSIVLAFGVIAVLSMGLSAKAMRDDVLVQKDPAILLDRIRANDCAVCYADFWIAYRFRLLDGERCAWIPYLSQNRTVAESIVMRQRAGQRCIARNDWTVARIDHDPPLAYKPPRGE